MSTSILSFCAAHAGWLTTLAILVAVALMVRRELGHLPYAYLTRARVAIGLLFVMAVVIVLSRLH